MYLLVFHPSYLYYCILYPVFMANTVSVLQLYWVVPIWSSSYDVYNRIFMFFIYFYFAWKGSLRPHKAVGFLGIVSMINSCKILFSFKIYNNESWAVPHWFSINHNFISCQKTIQICQFQVHVYIFRRKKTIHFKNISTTAFINYFFIQIISIQSLFISYNLHKLTRY